MGKIVLLGRNLRGEMTAMGFFLVACLLRSGIWLSVLIHPVLPIPAAGREISILLSGRVSSLCRRTSRFELSVGKVRLLGTISSPISIIPYLEKLDLQNKSIFCLNLCSNGKKT